MSCYPHDRRDEGEPDLLKAAKLLRYAKFAVRFQSKSAPNLRREASGQKKPQKSVPRYMKPSKASQRRKAENDKRLDIIAGKQEDAMVEDKRRLADKIAAAEVELEKLRLKEAEMNKTVMIVTSKKEDAVNEPVGEEKTATGFAEEDLKKRQQGLGGGIFGNSLLVPELASSMMPQIASPIKAPAVDNSSSSGNKNGGNSPPKLTGDGRSFTFGPETITISKMAAKRCFRVLTYRDLPNGKREVMDIPDGRIYFCKTGPQNRRITPDGVAFDTKQGAMSERFPTNQVSPSKSGNGTSPRILVAFDCWGKSARRHGGAGAARYQYCKFNKIMAFLDAPKTVSNKNVDHPIDPHYYPRADRRKAPRSPIDKAIYLDKMFNTKPWAKPTDRRPFTPEFKLDSIRPSVPSHKVPRRKTDD
jgi:hypothetical protein